MKGMKQTKIEIDSTPYRKEGESYEDYKARRKNANMWMKFKLKGFLFWNSKERGTYLTEYETQLQDNQVDS